MKPSTSKQPRIPRSFIANLSRSLALSTLAIFGFGRSNAADLTWDPAFDGGATGGAGTWNATLTNWWDGAANVAWPNLTTDTAVFGGAAGGAVVINTGSGISAGGLTFDTTGYNVSGNVTADVLTLGGATPTATVTNGADTATISAILAGSNGLVKAGAGKLVLSGANTLSGGITINAGTLSGAVATGASPFGTNTLNLAGGTLELTPTASQVAGLSYRSLTAAGVNGDTARVDFTQTAGAIGTTAQVNNNTSIPGPGGTTANLAVQYTGKLKVTTAGAYTFSIGSDDGSRLYINGVLVVNNDGSKGVVQMQTPTTITLSAGLHDIRMDYVQGSGGAGANLQYSGPDQAVLGAIPGAALFQAETNALAGSSNAVVVGPGIGNSVNVTSSSTINLNGSNFTQVQLGDYTQNTGTTLSVTGLDGKTLRLAGATTLGNSAGTVTINAAPNVSLSGVLSDGGNAITLAKTGTGRLIFDQTSAVNSLGATTTIDIQGGSAVLVGSTAAGSFNPIGSAAVRLNGGNLILDSKGATAAGIGATYNNVLSLAAATSGTIQSVANAATTTLSGGISLGAASTLTLDAIAGGQLTAGVGGDPGATLLISGPITGAVGTNLNIVSSLVGNNPQSTRGIVALAGNNSGFGGTATIQSGGVLQLNSALASVAVNLGGTLNLFTDGNGSAGPETVVYGDDVTMTAASTIAVNRLGNTFAPLFTTASNKTIQIDDLTTGGFGLTVNNLNGYGLRVAGITTLSGAEALNVGTATSTAPGVAQGLVLGGKVTGTATAITKSGAGTLLLENATNDFTGNITITGGVLGATSDAALGDSGNTITLNGTGAGFEAFETFSTARSLVFGNATAANNQILVAGGKTLTLTSALSGANGFQKSDPGTLILSGASGAYTGAWTASGGITRVTAAAASGTGLISIAGNSGTTLQLDGTGGNIALPNNVTIAATTGVNSGGALQSLAGANSVAGTVTLTGAAAIGADTGSTLSLGTVTAAANTLTLLGGGGGSISAFTGTGGLVKNGTGSWTLSGTSAFSGGTFQILQGALTLSGSAVYNGVNTPILSQAGTLILDNSVTNNNNRLNGRFSNMWFAGELRILGNAAAATTESTGGATNFTPSNAAGIVTLVPHAAQAMTFGSATTFPLSRQGTSTLLFRGTNLGSTSAAGVANIKFSAGTAATGQTGAAGTVNRGINPWALVDTNAAGFGISLAAYDATNGYQALTTGVDTSGSLPTSAFIIPNVRTSTGLNSATSLTINSLTLASGGGLDIQPGARVSLDSGAVLALTGNTGLGASAFGILGTTGNKELIMHVVDPTTGSGASLAVGATLAGFTGGMIKTGGGSLSLNTRAFYTGATTINGGLLTLNGGNNTLLPGQNLTLNHGATLGLGTNSQLVGDLFTASTGGSEAVQSGGNVTSSSSAATLVVNQSNTARTYAGSMSGGLTFNKAGQNALTLTKDQTYTGATFITGGNITLTDTGALSGTSAVQVNYGSLTISNTGLTNNFDRIPDAAPITLRSSTITFNGRAQTASTETLGALTLAGGASQVTVVAGGVGVNTADIIFTSFNAAGSMDGTLNFNQSASIAAGATRIQFLTPPTVTNNIVTPSIEFSAGDWATYIPNVGLAQLGAAGTAGYNGTVLPAVNQPTHNIKLAAAGTLPAGGLLLNTLNTTAANVTFAADSDVLNLVAGGLMHTGASSSIGATVDNGRLTAGGLSAAGVVPFYIHNGSNSFTINSRLVDPNISSQLRAIFTIYNAGGISLTNGLNSYSGGTVVNGWTATSSNLGLNGGPGAVVIPAGGLSLNNAAVVMNTNAGQIEATNVVTLTGASTLTLTGANTLNSLVFNNVGGTTGAVVNTGGVLTLSNATPISVTSSNVSSVPAINGTLDLAGTNKTFSIGAPTVNGLALAPYTAALNIAAALQNGSVTKTGNGNLQLSGQSTFAGGVNLTAGGIIIGANSTFGSSTLVSGPLGTGTLTAAAGTTILSSGAFSVGNDLTLLGNLTFDGINNVTFGGTTTLPASPVTINVAAPQQTASLIGGFVNPTTNITKTGFGTLILGGEYAGTLNLAGGGAFGIADDGDGSGAQEDVTIGMSVVSAGETTISVGRSGFDYAPYFPQAANKTLQLANLTTAGGALTVTNNNGYGLDVTGSQVFGNDQIYNVATASGSDVTQGLTLSGIVSGGFGIIKQGAGTLVLTNSGNTFGGAANVIDVQGGVLAATSDGALGHASNVVNLNAPGATFRGAETFSLSHTVNINSAANSFFDVTSGETLTVASAFGGAAGAGWTKVGNGTLVLGAANTHTGAMSVTQGVVRLTNGSALGTGVLSISPGAAVVGASLELAGVSVGNEINLQGNNNLFLGGINAGGQLRAASGTNTTTGIIRANFDAGVGAAAGATLNINGGINNNTTTARALSFIADGTINLNSAITSATATANQWFAIGKYGAGTLNINVAQPVIFTTGSSQNFTVSAGTMVLKDAGTVAASTAIGVSVLPGATLTLDNTATVVANRLGGRALSLTGGNLNLIGGATASNEAFGAPNFARGQSVVTVTSGAGGANLTFTAAANNPTTLQNGTAPSGATVLFRGTSLGTAAGAGVATIQGTTGGFTFAGQTGAAGATNKGILPWALVDSSATGLGTSFATADTATGILRPLAVNEYGTGATLVANSNQLITSAITGANTTNLNSITFDTGGSLAMSGTGIQTLTLSSGGILVRDTVSASLSGGILSAPAASVPITIHTPGTASLNVNTLFTGGNGSAPGLIKGGAGTLTFSSPTSSFGSLNGLSMNTINLQTVVNQGTLVVGANNVLGNNTYLEVGAGGTLDLNGKTVYALGLFTDGAQTGIDGVTAGGTVTSPTGGTLVTNSDARNWAGTISGNVFYNRTGTVSATAIYAPQTYTGGTLINGGTVQLRDYGRITGSSGIDLNYATLLLDNAQGADISGRLGSVPVTMRGGILQYNGRVQTNSVESIGAVSIAQGWNNIFVANGGTGINSAELTVASLTRPVGSAGIVALANPNGGVAQNGQIGSNPRMLIGTAPTLTNNLIGPWAIANREWVSYVPGVGVGLLNAVGFAGYAPTTLATASATDNVRISATTPVLTADTTIYTLNLNYGAVSPVVDLGTKTLTLAGGGLMIATGSDNNTATFSNGSITSGYANGSVNDLYVYHLPYAGTNRNAVISAAIVDNGATPVRMIFSSSEQVNNAKRTLFSGANSNTGGWVFNGGNAAMTQNGVIPAGGITLNGASFSQAVPIAGETTPGTINSANIVTLNGPSVMNFSGANTIAGLVFNNTGASAAGAGVTTANVNPTVNTFLAGVGPNGTGELTLGASGIVANSSNVATTSVINGRINTGSGLTITVNPVTVNGASVNPWQGTLALTGVTGTGDITKAGNGVLLLNNRTVNTGKLNVTAGGIAIGTSANNGANFSGQSGTLYSEVNLAANTFLNLNNTDGYVGGLSGSGNVYNVATTGIASGRTFGIGTNNTNTTFGGSLARWSDALPAAYAVIKAGSGTLTLTGVNTTTGNLTVGGGGVTFSGTGTGVFGTSVVLPGATLTLDNATTNVDHRLTGGLGTGGTLNVQGGNFRIVGNGSAPTSETIGTLNMSPGTNAYGRSVITLEADAAQSLTFTSAALTGQNFGSSGLIRGLSNVTGAGQANFALTGALGGSGGTGANGTTTMSIRPDIIGDASASGSGTAFVTKDSATGFLRPLASAELATTLPSGSATANVNYGLSTNQAVSATTVAGSLTLAGANVSLDTALTNNANGALPIATSLNTGGILAVSGNSVISTPRLESATTFNVHTVGNLNIDSVLAVGASGLTKSGNGTLTLSKRNVYAGQSLFNAGTTILNGGDNTLPLILTSGVPTTTPFGINGPSATVDLNGSSQLTGTFLNNTNARYTGGGGILTNSSATTSTFYTNMGSAQIFSGAITGNLNFNKSGNNALTLTGASTYTGSTNIRANTLVLVDSGALSGTSAVNAHFAGVTIDQSGINPVGSPNPVRIPAATPVSLRGSSLALVGGGSVDATAAFDTVNLTGAHNTISAAQVTTGGVTQISIGNLARTDADSTVNFSGGTGGFLSNNPGLNQSNVFIGNIDGNAIPATIPGKILGGWALANNGEFVTYISPTTTGANGQNFGIVTMNGTNGPLAAITQTAYDATTISVGNTPTLNVRISGTGTQTIGAGGATYNAVAVRAALTNLNFTGTTDTLNLASGGLALTNGGTTVGVLGTGRLTSGGTASGVSRLYIHSAGATNTINAAIVNNGTAGASTRLVVNAIANQLNLAGANTYTGGTVLNGAGGGVTLTGAAATVVIPAGGLTLNNVTLTMATNAGQIAAANDVTLNGGANLTLVGANTLNSLSFNNSGGTATPTVATGTTSLTLSATNAITAVNDNLATVPTISGTSLILPAGANINTSSTVGVPVALTIAAPITSAGAINKEGSGGLNLNATNTFAGGVNLNAGTVIVSNNAALGTGTLTMAGGTALASDGTLRTLTNALTINGNVTFGTLNGAGGSAVAGNGVTLNGAVALGAATNRSINVNSHLNVSTLGGIVSGAGSSITKTGPGTLVLSGANTFDGGVAINEGTLRTNATGLGSAGTISFGGGILQHTTTTDFSSRFSSAASQLFYIDTNNNAVVYASDFGSTGGSLAKFGANSLILTGTATYGGPTVIAAGTLQIGNNTTTGDIGGTGEIINSATLSWQRSDDDTLPNIISGPGALVKGRNGTLTLSGVNTFTGNVTIGQSSANQGGTLKITNSSALGVGPKTVTIISNNNPVGTQAELALDGSGGNITLASNISFTTSQASLTQPAIRNIAGDNVINGNFTLTGGGGSTSIGVDGGTLNLTGTFTPNQTGRFLTLVGAGTGGTVSGLVQDGSVTNTLAVQKEGTGTWTLANTANTYTLQTIINAGVLSVPKLSLGGVASSIGASTNAAGNLVLNGGTLKYTGTGDTTDRQFTIGLNGATLDASGSGALNFSSATPVTLAGTDNTHTLTLKGTNTDDNILAASIGNNGIGATSIVKEDAGTWVLSGTSAYTGSTTVNDGTLEIAGALTGTSSVDVFDGVLEVSGSISGQVNLADGILTGSSTSGTTGLISGLATLSGGTIKPGSATTNATSILNFDGGLTFSGASAAFDLNGTTAGTGFDQLNVSTLTLGSNVPFTLSLGFTPAPMTSFVLVDADTVALSGFEFSHAGNPLSEGETFFVGVNEFTFSYVGGSGNDPTVTFVVPEPGSAALLLGGLAMLAGRRRRKQA